VEGLQYTVPTFLPLLLVMSLVYVVRRRTSVEPVWDRKTKR